MRRGVYPGSFDPVTNGHLDIIRRASLLVDSLVVGVLNNTSKDPMFTLEERVRLIEALTRDIPNVSVQAFEGLSVDFARKTGAEVVFRGLRAVTDFELECQFAQTNKALSPDVETVFLITDLKYSYISSSTVKEVASFGGNVDMFVPELVKKEVMKKLSGKNKGGEK